MEKKRLISYIFAVILLITIVAGITYAYFRYATNSGSISGASDEIDIDYTISNANLSGTLLPSTSRSDGIMESVTARLNNAGDNLALNLYITPTTITGITPAALKWEVDVINTSSTVLNHYSGSFSGAVVNTPIAIVSNYPLTTNTLTYNIYVWLDGASLTSIESNNQFVGVVSAESSHVTGVIR